MTRTKRREGLACILSMCPHPECACHLVYVDGFVIDEQSTAISWDEDGVHVSSPAGAEPMRATLASLVPLRAELEGGDLRALYLAWILSAQLGELDDGDMEPPCPPGLGKLTAPLEAFVEFVRVDRNLIKVAATASPELTATDDAALERWVAALPEAEKTTLLVRMVGGAEAHLRAGLLRRFRESRTPEAPPAKARTVGELLKAAEGRAEERRRQKAEYAAREKAHREREAAEARERHLAALAKREAEAWRELDTLIATKQPKKYDEAVALLGDLRDVCAPSGRQVEAATRIARLREEHTKKPSLVERFRKAGLTTWARPSARPAWMSRAATEREGSARARACHRTRGTAPAPRRQRRVRLEQAGRRRAAPAACRRSAGGR